MNSTGRIRHAQCRRRTFSEWIGVGVALALLLVTLSCGYRVATKNRLSPSFRSVAVVPLTNETTTFEVEQILTRALVHELVQRSDFDVRNDASQAEAVLEGSVFRLSANPVTFGRAAFGSTFLVTLHARVALKERQTGRILFQNNNYIFREQYVISNEVETFFSELNPALDRIGKDFAASVVSTILEDF